MDLLNSRLELIEVSSEQLILSMAALVVFSTWSLVGMLNSRLELIEVSSEQLILSIDAPDRLKLSEDQVEFISTDD